MFGKWDNPHGTLSADERLRAERLAKIQADAIREAHRDIERRERLHATSTPVIPTRSSGPRPLTESQIAWGDLCRRTRQLQADIDKTMAGIANRAEFGTEQYIRARYGRRVWREAVAECQERLGCTEEEAAEAVIREYTEDGWRDRERPGVERYIRR